MSKVYLYSRVSTEQQSLEQQERTVYEWLKAHNMKVDEVVSDEGISGGVSYQERGLGKVILPKIKEGDMLIVSEISRLGRSMFDLSKLINEELKPRKVRLVVVGMGIDLDCSKMTAIDELILSNFSFAAQLEKQLISERTLSALQVKKQQGIKLGGASEIYKANRAAKSKETLVSEERRRASARTKSFLQRPDSVAFLKVIRRTFPQCCNGDDIAKWNWCGVNYKSANITKMAMIMRDFKEMNSSLFASWDLSDITSKETKRKVTTYVNTFKRSASTYIYYSQAE